MLPVIRRKRKAGGLHLPARSLASSSAALPSENDRFPRSFKRKTYLPISALASLLQKCTSARALLEGRRAHFLAVCCFHGDIYLGNLLLHMYGKCGCLLDVRATFNKMASRNSFSWNILISAYSGCCCVEGALELFREMVNEGIQPDRCTFAIVLNAIATLGSLCQGMRMHFALLHEGLQPDAHLESALVSMYGKCGSIEDSQEIFRSLPHKDVALWNAMITAYSEHGVDSEALKLYQRMPLYGVKYCRITFVRSLCACTNLKAILYGMIIHAQIVEDGHNSDLIISTELVRMYSNCGRLEDARIVFQNMAEHDLISFSAMISVNTQHGENEEALTLFSKLLHERMRPDKVTLMSVISVCANEATLPYGLLIHASSLESGVELDLSVGNALVNMYGKCGSLSDTKYVFDKMSTRNVISWTTMIEAQACVGHAKETFRLFSKMLEHGIAPNDVTFLNVLCSCSRAGLIEEGCFFYNAMIRFYEIQATMEHFSSMGDLFGRAGLLAEAEFFISKIPIEPNAVIWEALLSACRVHNDFERAKQIALRAMLLDSEFSASYVLLSNIYSAEGNWDDAA